MLHESLSILVGLALLELIGIGPALQLLPVQPKQVHYSIAVAPILGFVILEILGLPLVRYVGPVQVWALPLTILLIGISTVLALLWLRTNRTEQPFRLVRNSLMIPAAVFFLCYVVLASPMIVMGIQYTIFRSNASDAFTYISLAETLRIAPWNVLVQGIKFSSENFAAIERLAAISPGALLTARMVGLPIQLGNMVTLAWFSHLTGLPTYAAYYPYHVLAFLNALLVGIVWGDVLGLKRVKYAAAVVIALGFWARYVLETDASFEIITIPLMLLTTFAWVQLEQYAPTKWFSPVRLLLAVSLTAILCNYLVFPGLFAIGFVVFNAVALIRRERSLVTLAYHGVTAMLVLLFLTITGQIDMQFLSLRYIVGAIDLQRAFEPTVFNMWSANGVSAVWGMGTETLLGAQRALLRLPLAFLSNLFGLLLSALLIIGAWLALFRSRRLPEQILFAILIAGATLSLWSFAGGNLRASGKAFTYIYPYVVLGIAVSAASVGLIAPSLERAAFAVVMCWFVVQIILGIFLPYTNALTRVFNYARRTEAYDLSPITRVLSANPPKLLWVAVPLTDRWEFPYYTSLVLGRFHTHSAGGLILDNSTGVQNFWAQSPGANPDYAVIRKTHDIIAGTTLGEPIAETSDLILYHLEPAALDTLNAQERQLRANDQAKPVFEHTLPLLFGAH